MKQKEFIRLHFLFCFLLPIQIFFQSLSAQDNQKRLPHTDVLHGFRHNMSAETARQLPHIHSRAMWQTQFLYSASDTLNPANPNGFLQGICWTGHEFWMGIWGGSQANKIFRINKDGSLRSSFSISGISNVTGLVANGSSVFAVNESNRIFEIDTSSLNLVQSISLPAHLHPTFVAYSPEADGGNGGFYVGEFELYSDIYLLSQNGTLLDSIPASVHGCRLMMGAVWDNFSQGQPWLWVFDQPLSPSEGIIRQLSMPSGIPTGIYKDVSSDLGSDKAAAGGLFLAKNFQTNLNILGGVLQDVPSDQLFGYELDFQIPQVDAHLTEAITVPALTEMPFKQLPDSIAFSGKVTNRGLQTLHTLSVHVHISDQQSGNLIYSDNQNLPSIDYQEETTFNFGNWKPVKPGKFLIRTFVQHGNPNENIRDNDSLTLWFSVGDSSLVRDNGQQEGTLGLGYGAEKQSYFGQVFEVYKDPFDYLTAISFSLSQPTAGDYVRADVFVIDDSSGKPVGVPVTSSIPYQISASDALKDIRLTLPLASGPYPVFPGKFLIAIQEGEHPLNLGISSGIYQPGTLFIKTHASLPGIQSGEWTDLHQALNIPIKGALQIQAHFGPCVPEYMRGSIAVTDDSGSGNGKATATVSGASGVYDYLWDDPLSQTGPTASGLIAGQNYHLTVTDTTGCIIEMETGPIPLTTAIREELDEYLDHFSAFFDQERELIRIDIDFQNPETCQLRLTDMNGKKIWEKGIHQQSSIQLAISTHEWGSGIYLLNVYTERGQKSKKLWLD